MITRIDTAMLAATDLRGKYLIAQPQRGGADPSPVVALRWEGPFPHAFATQANPRLWRKVAEMGWACDTKAEAQVALAAVAAFESATADAEEQLHRITTQAAQDFSSCLGDPKGPFFAKRP